MAIAAAAEQPATSPPAASAPYRIWRRERRALDDATACCAPGSTFVGWRLGLAEEGALILGAGSLLPSAADISLAVEKRFSTANSIACVMVSPVLLLTRGFSSCTGVNWLGNAIRSLAVIGAWPVRAW